MALAKMDESAIQALANGLAAGIVSAMMQSDDKTWNHSGDQRKNDDWNKDENWRHWTYQGKYETNQSQGQHGSWKQDKNYDWKKDTNWNPSEKRGQRADYNKGKWTYKDKYEKNQFQDSWQQDRWTNQYKYKSRGADNTWNDKATDLVRAGQPKSKSKAKNAKRMEEKTKGKGTRKGKSKGTGKGKGKSKGKKGKRGSKRKAAGKGTGKKGKLEKTMAYQKGERNPKRTPTANDAKNAFKKRAQAKYKFAHKCIKALSQRTNQRFKTVVEKLSMALDDIDDI